MSQEQQKKAILSGHSIEQKKQAIEQNRASKQEILDATKRGIERYRTVLNNLAKR